MTVPELPTRPLFPAVPDVQRDTPSWPLAWFILWRLVGALLAVFLVLTALFIVLEVVPVDPSRILLPRGCGTPGGIAGPRCGIASTLIAQWGLDKPLWDRYLIFLGNVFTGNLGLSTSLPPRGAPVWTIIAPALPPTLALLGITLFLAALVSLTLGLPLGRRQGSRVDAAVSFLLAIPYSLTAPALALLAVYLLAFAFPVVSVAPRPGLDLGPYAVVVVLALASVAGLFTWIVRDHPLRPRIAPPPAPGDWRTSADRGDGRMRGAIARFFSGLPALTAWTLAVVFLSEAVWNLNGIGRLLWLGILNQDAFVILGVLVVSGLLIVLPILLAADIVHEWLTGGWVRRDGKSVHQFDVRLDDLIGGLRTVLTRLSGLAGILLILAFIIVSALAPVLVGPYPSAFNLSQPNLPPSGAHPLGTNGFGQEVLTLLAYGGIPLIWVALFAVTVTLAASLAVMAASGLLGPRADVFLLIVVDAGLLLPFPGFVAYAYGWPGVWGYVLPGLLAWPITTRILLREVQGILRAETGPGRLGVRARGRRTLDLIWGTGPLIVGNVFLAVSLALCASSIMDLFGLSVVGPGTFQSWGAMMAQAYFGLDLFRGEWWTFVPPALCLFVAVLAPTLVGLTAKRLPLGGERRSAVPAPAPSGLAVPEVAPPQ